MINPSQQIVCYGDVDFFGKILNILKKFSIDEIDTITVFNVKDDFKLHKDKTNISHFIVHKNDTQAIKTLLDFGVKKSQLSMIDFHIFMAIIDFAGNDKNKIVYFLQNIQKFEKLYKGYIKEKFPLKTKYDVAILMNMVNFRTGVLEIAQKLEKKYSVINLFLNDKERFRFKNMINLDEEKVWNNAIFNARFKYLHCSDIVLSPSEDNFGKVNINCMHNSNYKPIDTEKLIDGVMTPHYHFIPTKTMFELFKKVLMEHKDKIKHKVVLIPAGYPKLDKLIKELGRLKHIKKDAICYAPTMLMHNNDFTDTLSLNDGAVIIQYLLDTFPQYKIIFRPHPNVKTYKHHNVGLEIIESIIEQFKTNERFIYDNSSYYIDTFARTRILISDYSSIMQTFAFATLIPFISLSKKELTEVYKKNLGIDDYREETGKIVGNVEELEKNILDILNNSKKYTKQISIIRKNELYNIGKSVKYIVDNFDFILKNKKNKEWYYANNK